MTRPLGDDLLVRRAGRRLALQAAGVVAAAMLLLVALVTLVVVRGQQSATDALLRTTAATADDVSDPPAGAWVLISRGAELQASPGLPDEVGEFLAGARRTPGPVPVLPVPVLSVPSDDGGQYRVVTVQRADRTVQVAVDLRPQQQQRDRLLRAMGAAAVLSLVVAAGMGLLLGRQAVRPLARALALQRMFVADASHELRTPLTLLSTRAQVLHHQLRSGDRTEQVLQDARGVVTDVQRLGEVVDDLLVAADPRADNRQESVDVVELVAGAAESATAHAVQAGVALTVAPDVRSRPLVLGSAVALRRAVLALVDNAVDHTPAGGRVQLAVRSDRRDVVIGVSDTGSGIDPEGAAQVLQRFHSGGQRAGRVHYGLGLALTHDVANRHGGELRLAPATVGTTFELVLPLA